MHYEIHYTQGTTSRDESGGKSCSREKKVWYPIAIHLLIARKLNGMLSLFITQFFSFINLTYNIFLV